MHHIDNVKLFNKKRKIETGSLQVEMPGLKMCLMITVHKGMKVEDIYQKVFLKVGGLKDDEGIYLTHMGGRGFYLRSTGVVDDTVWEQFMNEDFLTCTKVAKGGWKPPKPVQVAASSGLAVTGGASSSDAALGFASGGADGVTADIAAAATAIATKSSWSERLRPKLIESMKKSYTI